MYRKEKPLALKGSTSALANNLSIQVNLNKNVINYAVVHKSVVNVVTTSTDGTAVNHRQIVCKEPSATAGAAMVLQARLIGMPHRTLLVITSQRGIQMFEADGSIMLFWYALGEGGSLDVQTCFGRGICNVLDSVICVGCHNGHILVFSVPPKGTNITLSETLTDHKTAICDLKSQDDMMASSDDSGNILVWKAAGDSFKLLVKLAGVGYPCSSVAIWDDLVVGGYASGHIRVYKMPAGKIVAEVTAHARWITGLDVAPGSGTLLSASEDSFVRVWQLKSGPDPEISHRYSESITDMQLQGAQFISEDGRAFGVSGYDSNEIVFFRQH